MIDEKDRRILDFLKGNARASYTEIAQSLGISDATVIKRVKRLEQLGVIKGYTAIINPKKLGYNAVSITGVDVEPEYIFKVLSFLREKDYIKYLALTSGDHTIIATIWAKTSSELAKILNKISSLPGVKKVCPAIILDVVKE